VVPGIVKGPGGERLMCPKAGDNCSILPLECHGGEAVGGIGRVANDVAVGRRHHDPGFVESRQAGHTVRCRAPEPDVERLPDMVGKAQFQTHLTFQPLHRCELRRALAVMAIGAYHLRLA